jgi:uncharacterized FlaG/YvyC family protein
MDMGQSAKASPAPAAYTPQRAEMVAVARDAVRTELAPPKSLQPVEQGEAIRFQPSQNQEQRAQLDTLFQHQLEKSMFVDKATNTFVFRATDSESGLVVKQYPEEAILRLRAYVRENFSQEPTYEDRTA